MMLCYVITRICTVEGKLTLRAQTNNEIIQRA